MSGYKRVNYYELCRLCATNQQKEKTHIFQEEGRKIQLLNKIQSCLSLTVYEHDFLPKVVCSKCLKSLETYYTFKQECVSSETMLSSYFKNFRYTEDFKKSGKVYIKDTTIKNTDEQEIVDVSTTSQVVTSTQPVQVAAPAQNQPTAPLLPNYVTIAGTLNEAAKATHHQNQAQIEQVQSYYAVQLPQTAIVSNHSTVEQKSTMKTSELPSKIVQHSQVAYNLNTVNLASTNVKTHQKPQETINNVVVNANGEVINIGQLVDLESIINQASVPKIVKSNNNNFKQKRVKETKISDEPIIKIDLTENEQRNTFDSNTEKLPHIKSTQNLQKYTYSASKIEEKVQVNVNPTVIFNTVQDYQVPISNFVPFHQNSGNISYNNTSGSAVNIATSTVCTSSSNEHSTVNLNALNGDMVGGAYRNSTQFAAQQQPVKQNVREAVKPENSFKTTQNGEKLHVCDICHKSFKRREHLYQHIKLHTGFRPYSCENCNKSFMRKEHLLRHMTSHSGQKNYTCNICEKSFSRNDNLLKHKKTHEKQNSFTCEVCQKQFVMKHYYLAHKVSHGVVERCIGQTLGILKA